MQAAVTDSFPALCLATISLQSIFLGRVHCDLLFCLVLLPFKNSPYSRHIYSGQLVIQRTSPPQVI